MQAMWIVDGAYLLKASAPRRFDYLKLKRYLEQRNGASLARAYYLNSSGAPTSPEQTKFHEWLQAPPPRGPGMLVYLYPLKDMWFTCPRCGTQSSRAVQAGVDVGLAVLLVQLAAQNAYDRVFLSAGDGDLEDAAACVTGVFAKELVIVGFHGTVAPEIEDYAAGVIWLDEIFDRIALTG